MKTVLTFGTFDILHPGHEFFLKEAKTYGDRLVVVIALDSTVEHVKKKKPVNRESERLRKVLQLEYVDKALLGNEDDKYKVIETINPDVIVLGYDQNSFTEGLEKELEKRGLSPLIVRLEKAHKPDIYKSSKLLKQ